MVWDTAHLSMPEAEGIFAQLIAILNWITEKNNLGRTVEELKNFFLHRIIE
jgi:hypothetical protein